MKKYRWMLILLMCLIVTPVFAQTSESADPKTENAEAIIKYGINTPRFAPDVKELTPEEDDLYDGSDIKPLRGTLSDAEKAQEGGSFEDEDKPRLPELLCSDSKLREQVSKFVYDYNNKQPKHTVPARREQVLMTRNMKEFEEISEDELKKNFDAAASLMHLRINERREIYRICASKDNDNKRFRNFYIILYPFLNFYKVVVTNVVSTPENLNEATFIYNW